MAALNKFERWFGSLLLLIGVLLILACPGLLLLQAVWWLKDDVWTPLACRTFWIMLGGSEPAVTWLGVRVILNGLLDAPLSLGMLFAGIPVIIVGSNLQ